MNRQDIRGGQAFPLVKSPVGLPDQQYWGMTLRDYFAAKSLAVLIQGRELFLPDAGGDKYVDAAYAWADQMLKSRESAPAE